MEYPPKSELSIDKQIVGIGAYSQKLKFYFIFSDASTSYTKDLGEKSKFKEMYIYPASSQIIKVKLQFISAAQASGDQDNFGCFTGLKFYDLNNQAILTAGRITTLGQSYTVQEFSLQDG